MLEIIKSIDITKHKLAKVVIWGNENLFMEIGEYAWLKKISPNEVNYGLFKQILWRKFKLSSAARQESCDLLFIPGGTYNSSFNPVITMCQNMLPFQWKELLRYKLSLATIRLILLRWLHSISLRKSDGIIFLTDYAKNEVRKTARFTTNLVSVIPHGINKRFFYKVKKQYPIESYSFKKPYRIIYVSGIHPYKHQHYVVDAVSKLRDQGLPLVLDLVGPSYLSYLLELKRKISVLDPDKKWINYHGELPYESMGDIYKEANLAIFASSCENMPNILLEKMSTGLPIACSDRSPMPEILGNDGVYFNPEKPVEIANALGDLIKSPDLRYKKACASFERSSNFSWELCSANTFSFFEGVISNYKNQSK